ncbi:MAG: hypothetical protein WC763_02440 [Candidatus Paceibacterota bacterium]|jgi:hypothetical protein
MKKIAVLHNKFVDGLPTSTLLFMSMFSAVFFMTLFVAAANKLGGMPPIDGTTMQWTEATLVVIAILAVLSLVLHRRGKAP